MTQGPRKHSERGPGESPVESAPSHERIDIALGERSYPILIGPGLLEDAQLLGQHVPARNLLIVTNEKIGRASCRERV